MGSRIDGLIDRWVEELRAGTLTEESLLQGKGAIGPESRRQDLLFLTCGTTAPTAMVNTMKIVENGESYDGPADPEDWPYKTLLDAIRDGWRIVKFPEQALLLSEEKSYGLGCEYVLERWG